MDNSAQLLAEAVDARLRARVPYSHFAVGAAVLGKSGRIYKGCNIENISLRLTLCAEEVAVGAAVANGEKELIVIAVVADSDEPVMPCGACRQLLAEFNPATEIVCAKLDGSVEHHTLDELLPRAKQGILEQRQS